MNRIEYMQRLNEYKKNKELQHASVSSKAAVFQPKYYAKEDLPGGGARYLYSKAEWDAAHKNDNRNSAEYRAREEAAKRSAESLNKQRGYTDNPAAGGVAQALYATNGSGNSVYDKSKADAEREAAKRKAWEQTGAANQVYDKSKADAEREAADRNAYEKNKNNEENKIEEKENKPKSRRQEEREKQKERESRREPVAGVVADSDNLPIAGGVRYAQNNRSGAKSDADREAAKRTEYENAQPNGSGNTVRSGAKEQADREANLKQTRDEQYKKYNKEIRTDDYLQKLRKDYYDAVRNGDTRDQYSKAKTLETYIDTKYGNKVDKTVLNNIKKGLSEEWKKTANTISNERSKKENKTGWMVD